MVFGVFMKVRFEKAISMMMVAGLAMTSLAGCSGADDSHKIVIRSEDVSADYNMVMSDYADVTLTQKISCIYSQVDEEKLSFSIEKRELTHVYVADGDKVEAGQLVAKLNVDDLERKQRDNDEKIEQNNLLIDETQKMIDYYDSLLKGSLSLTRREEIELKRVECVQDKETYEHEIESCKEDNADLTDTIEKAKLYAGMDGTVSGIDKAMIGTRPSKNVTVMKIINTDHCSFVSKDDEAFEFLHEGDPVKITVSDEKQYEATVYDVDEENGRVVIDLDEPDYSIQMSTRGTIYLELEKHENVLALPVGAVHSTDEFYYVYKLNENGVRELVEIEVGLVGSDLVEIKSGINPYDSVILRKA